MYKHLPTRVGLKHNREVMQSCLKASGFKNAEAAGDIMIFGDDVGYDALDG